MPEKINKTDIVVGWIMVAAVAFFSALILTGCNTVAGLGKDIQASADGIRAKMAEN